MGANTDYRRYPDKRRKELLEEWNNAVQSSQYENGHSYSGCIGMLYQSPVWRDKSFESGQAAEDYISKRHEKWEAPYAVSYICEGAKFWVIGGWCSS